MVSIQDIENFLKNKKVAVIGASQNKKKFGYIVMRFLEKRGYEIFPVNPKAREIDGTKCYSSVHALPEDLNAAVLITKPDVTEEIINEIIKERRIEYVWLQQGAENINAINTAKQSGINIIHGECIMMFAKSSGFPHSIHRFLKKTFGKYPIN